MTHKVQSALQIFNRNNMRYSAYQMLNYLDEQTLLNLQQSLSSQHHADNNSYLLKLTQALILTKKYLNKVDRSIYYYFYQENFIGQTDYANTISLVQKNSTTCSEILKQYNKLFFMLKEKCLMSQYQIDKLQQIVCDSDLALPNNLRQNVGKYCNSPYQFYVCSLLNSSSYGDIDIQTHFQNFRRIVNQRQQIYLKQILKYRNNNSEQEKEALQKIVKLRLHPSQSQSAQNLMVQGFQLHNTIVILLALVDQVLHTFKTYISSIQNPFNKFVQFNLRYSVFRNFIIQAQQNFGFAFKAYNTIFEDGFNCSMPKEDFLFSKICINKFKRQMIFEIQQVIPIYIYLNQKVRESGHQSCFQSNQPHTQQYIASYIGSAPEGYLMNNKQSLSMCMEEFIQIFVDLSVNLSNINQCGHSQMKMSKEYYLLQSAVINQSLLYAGRILYGQYQVNPQQITQTLQRQLRLLQKLNIKPVTLRKLCEQLNIMSQPVGVTLYYNYTQKDGILQNINRSSYKYSSEFGIEKQNMMIRSQITDDSSNSDNNQWQYNSEEDGQLFAQIEDLNYQIEGE